MACTATLPVISTDLCNPTVRSAQITKIFWTLAGDDHDLTSAADDAEWATRLSDSTVYSGTPPAKIRTLPVIGSLPLPSVSPLEISLGRKHYPTPDRTLSFKIDDLSLTNIAAVNDVTNGNTYKIWFLAGGLLWGGNSGIDVTMQIDIEIPEGRGEIITGSGQCTWLADALPDPIVDPFL